MFSFAILDWFGFCLYLHKPIYFNIAWIYLINLYHRFLYESARHLFISLRFSKDKMVMRLCIGAFSDLTVCCCLFICLSRLFCFVCLFVLISSNDILLIFLLRFTAFYLMLIFSFPCLCFFVCSFLSIVSISALFLDSSFFKLIW